MSQSNDDGQSVVAGLLYLLLTGFLCCRGEPAPAKPVSAVGGADVFATHRKGRSCGKQGKCAPRKPPRPQEGENEGGGSDTHTSSGGGSART